jgi:tetratricopeptide (TPR) repeat protein
LPPWFRNIPDDRLVHPSLVKTFERSFAGLRRRDRHASALLGMLAHLQPDDIPLSLLRRWARRERPWRDPGAVDRALLSLADEHLAGVDGDSISLHQITQRLRRASLGRRDRERAVALASDFVSSVLAVDALSSDEQRAAVRLWPHAASVGRAAMTLGVARLAHADLLRGAARQRMLPGDYQGASELLADARAIVAGIPDTRPRHRATVLIDIATNERHQARYLEAIGPLTRAIDDLDEPGEDTDASAVLVSALRARAITMRQSDDPGLLASAQDDMRRALALAEGLPRGERRDHEVAVTRGELGRLLYDFYQAGCDADAQQTSVLAEARASLEAAVAFHDVEPDQQGKSRWQVPLASELDNLGLVLGAGGRYREAVRAGARALQLDEQTYHARHSEVATDLANLARTLLLARRPAIALGLARRSLDIREINEPGNPKVGEAALLVARSLPNGRRTEALALVDCALAIYSEKLHPSGPRTAEALALRRELAAGD